CLRQHVTSDVRIHGIITNGGSAPNITPDYAACRFYIRAGSREYLNKLYKKVIDCAKGAELMTGARLRFKNFENSFDNVRYVKSLQSIMEKNLKKVGIENISSDEESSAGSSDIGNVSQVCPTMYTEIALEAPENVKVHEKEILKYLSSEYAHDKMNKSILAMVLSAVELSQNSNKF
ncbi:MAG: M20 family peptidase, partial [Cetobacterium sp.]